MPGPARQWVSLNGNLRVAEIVSIGYDPLNNTFFSGTQDNGSNVQVPATVQGAPNISFTDVADPDPDTIARTDGGSWITDGFAAGMTIRIGGAGGNNGDYTIGSLTASTITLAAGETVATAAAAGGISVIQIFTAPVDSNGDGVPDDFATRSQWTMVTSPHNAAGFGFAPRIFTGDGNTTAAIPIDTNADGIMDQTIRFSMANTMTSLTALVYDVNGNNVTPPTTVNGAGTVVNSLGNPMVTVGNFAAWDGRVGLRSGAGALMHSGLDPADQNPGGYFIVPMTVNALDSTRMIVGLNSLYESNDRLETITRLQQIGGNGLLSAVAYGGMFDLTGNPTLDFADGAPNTIGRSAGSFITDGFEIGQTLVIGNAGANNGSYRVDAVAADTLTVSTIGATPALTNALAVAGATLGNADALYAIRGNNVFVRTTGGFGSNALTAQGSIPGAGQILDLALDPSDWRTAYAVDSRNVYQTTDAGANWQVISSQLGVPNLRSVEFVETDSGRDALLVGTNLGVYRAFDPVPGVAWTEVGRALPNALIADIDFTDVPGGADDMLAVGTLGRGVFSLSGDADVVLGQDSVLTITGTAADDFFTVQRKEGNSSILEIFANSLFPVFEVPVASVATIQIDGLGGDDTLNVNSTNGEIALADGLRFNGGADSNTLIFSGGTELSKTETVDSGVTRVEIDAVEFRNPQVVFHENVGTVTDNLTVATDLQRIGVGLEKFLEQIDLLADPNQSTSAEFAVLGTSLPRALTGGTASAPSPLSDPGAIPEVPKPFGLQTADILGFKRLIEEGLGAFGLEDIVDGTITDFDALRVALDGLDDIDGNVTFVTDGLGRPTFSVEVVKRLEGRADFETDFSFLGGSVDLGGLIDIDAEVVLDIDLGIDATGFFVDTSAAGNELVIRDVSLDGDASVAGRFGFFDVDITVDQLTVDDDVELSVNLVKGGDGKLRFEELLTDIPGLFDIDVSGNPAEDDVVLGISASVKPIIPGTTAEIDLGNAALELTWADVSDVSTVSVTATAGLAQDLIDFLRVGPQQVLDQLTTLREFSASFNGVEVALLSDTLDQIIDVIETIDSKVIDPLVGGFTGTANFGSIQDLIIQLAKGLGIDPTALGLDYNSTTKELTWDLNIAESFTITDQLNLGFDLESGLADLSVSTDASITAAFAASMAVGIDLDDLISTPADPGRWVFIKDPTVSALLDISAVDLDASARFGFVEIEIVDGSLTADPQFTLALSDPETIAPGGRIELGELLDALGTVSLGLSGSATILLPIAVPFLSISAAPDTTVTLTWTDLSDPNTISISDFPSGLSDVLPDFTNMDAGTLVSLLGQITNWLEDFRRDFGSQNIPLVGDALDEVLAFADLFQNTLLFDDGGDGTDDSNTLVSDINDALSDAGLGDRIVAEAVDGFIHLFAIDRSITAFSLTAAGGNALGFGASQSAVNNNGRIELVASSAATGFELLGDVIFNLSIGAAAPIAVTVTQASTTGNTSVGNDRRKLLDADNRPTFRTVDQMVGELLYILGIDIVQYDSVTKELTLDLDLGDPTSTDNFGILDVPLSFDLLDFETAGLFDLSSDSNIRLSAGGGLSLELGVFLGSEGGIELTETTSLADLKDGIEFSNLQTISADNDVDIIQGQLTGGDATFTLVVDGGTPVEVTVQQFAGAPGTDINVSHHTGRQEETTIAVNPVDPNNIIVAVNDLDPVDGIFGSTFSNDHVYVTTDGGLTWARQLIPTPAGTPAPASSHGDPTIVFSRDGSMAVFAHMVDKTPAQHGASDVHAMATAVSFDGGVTWDPADTGLVGSFALDEDGDGFTDDADKEFLAVGPDFADPSVDRFVMAFHRGNVIYVSTSLDALTWTTPVVVGGLTSGSSTAAPEGNSIDSIPAVGPNGEIYVVWEEFGTQNQSKIMFDVSFDGGVTWGGGNDTQVFFASDESALTADDLAILDDFAGLLNADPTLVVTIAGYTDTTGTDVANQTLSDDRAQSVFDYLTGAAAGSPHSIAGSRLTQLGFGESHLAVATGDGVDEAANRRVELTIDRLVYTGSVNVFDDTTSGGEYTVPVQPSRGIWMGLSMAVDRSGGDNDGRIYVSFADQGDLDENATTGHDDTDIFVIASVDMGQTWTTLNGNGELGADAVDDLGIAPVRVNFDDVTTNSQIFPWLDVDQSTGNVAVSWYDARNDDGLGGIGDTDNIANNDVMYYASYSSDGGLTWAPNIQVSDAASSAALTGGGDYGDYTGLAFHNGTIHMTWADTSDSTVVEAPNPDGVGTTDAYYDKINLLNTTFGDLLADINIGLANAGLDDQVRAVADGNRITLEALGGVNTIELSATTGNPAHNGDRVPRRTVCGYSAWPVDRRRYVYTGGEWCARCRGYCSSIQHRWQCA